MPLQTFYPNMQTFLHGLIPKIPGCWKIQQNAEEQDSQQNTVEQTIKELLPSVTIAAALVCPSYINCPVRQKEVSKPDKAKTLR